MVLPDQHREGIIKNPKTGKRDATYNQAVNYLAVIEAEGIESADFVTHSYGSLILDEMFRIAEEKGLKIFEDSKVAMLAPAGFNETENIASLGFRFVKSLSTEPKKGSKHFPDQPAMMKAGMGNFMANIPRTGLEAWELTKRDVGYFQMVRKLGRGSIFLFPYAADVLMPQEKLYSGMEKAVEGGVPASMPIGPEYDGKQAFDATHNDEQFNPPRVASAVAQVFKR